jgi:protein-S-isoprenylcysteine O-methyltransferase Ste14
MSVPSEAERQLKERNGAMSLIPAFEIGVWNAWILQVLFFLTLIVPNLLMSKEGKERTKKAMESVPFGRTHKILAYSTHMVIMPFTVLYSIFLPLKIGTVWLYVGLAIFALALAMSVITSVNFATTPLDEPVTKGVYRISRHPIYFTGFLLYIGIGIATASWVMLLCAILWIVLFHIALPSEEHFLLEKYGDSYREYMHNTPRWIGFPKS